MLVPQKWEIQPWGRQIIRQLVKSKHWRRQCVRWRQSPLVRQHMQPSDSNYYVAYLRSFQFLILLCCMVLGTSHILIGFTGDFFHHTLGAYCVLHSDVSVNATNRTPFRVRFYHWWQRPRSPTSGFNIIWFMYVIVELIPLNVQCSRTPREVYRWCAMNERAKSRVSPATDEKRNFPFHKIKVCHFMNPVPACATCSISGFCWC